MMAHLPVSIEPETPGKEEASETPDRRLPAVGDLESLFRRLNLRHFQGRLPECRVVWNRRLRTTAGRVDVRRRLIELSPSYHRRFEERELRDTLLHEMIHVAQHVRGRRVGHTPEMKRMARRLGIRRIHAKEVPDRRPPRYRYRCPACGLAVWRRIRIGRHRNACAACCDRWNRGRWHARFVLVLDEELPPPARASRRSPPGAGTSRRDGRPD